MLKDKKDIDLHVTENYVAGKNAWFKVTKTEVERVMREAIDTFKKLNSKIAL